MYISMEKISYRFDFIPYHVYLYKKLPGPSRIITVRGDQDISQKINKYIQSTICYMHAVAPKTLEVKPGAPAPILQQVGP